MAPRSEIGTTIKLEEFKALPIGLIKAGVVTNSAEDGVDANEIDSQLLLFRVVKYSDQDWTIYVSAWTFNRNLSYQLAEAPSYEDCKRLDDYTEIKRLFNVSKQVFKLLY